MPLELSNEGTRLIPLKDAAIRLGGISVWTLRKQISLGRVKIVRLGARVFLSDAEISRIVREGLESLPSPAKAKAASTKRAGAN